MKNYNKVSNSSPQRIGLNYFRRLELNYGNVFNDLDKESRILEIGPGSGFLTQYMIVKGFKNIELCELDPHNGEALKSFFSDKVNVIVDNVIDYLMPVENKYDLIISMQVIEHMTYDQVKSFIIAAEKALKPGGLLVSETINCSHLVGSYLRYSDYTHFIGFTPRSLRQFLESFGTFEDVEYLDINLHNNFSDLVKLYFSKGEMNKTVSSKLDFIKSNGESMEEGFRKVSISRTLLHNYVNRSLNAVSSLFNYSFEVEDTKVKTPLFTVKCRKCLQKF